MTKSAENQFHDNLYNLLSFLVWAESDNIEYAGVTGQQALESFCQITGYDPTAITKVILGE